MLISGIGAGRQLPDADVRRDRGDRRRLGTGAGHALDEAREILRQCVELALANQALPVSTSACDDHEVGHHATRFAGGGDLLVVVDGRADAQAADDADGGHVSPS